MRRTVPRGTLRKIIKKHKPHLRLAANTDLLVHLSFLLFLHRLAEEARTNAFENKSKIIKPEHTIAAAKTTQLLQKDLGAYFSPNPLLMLASLDSSVPSNHHWSEYDLLLSFCHPK
uniref:Centromere protein W n=1 Tax=Gallus gallus TaxID=9031 RepID=A0A8V0XUX9_CHICK